jgi:triosephosphate isomerase
MRPRQRVASPSNDHSASSRFERTARERAWLGAGWKMHKSIREATEYCVTLRDYLAKNGSGANLFVLPSFTALSAVCGILNGSGVYVGAQNMHWEEAGPFTGEVSPLMLREIGVSLVELGHAERRAEFGETDYTVNRKVLSALEHDLRPLICVGESAMEAEFDVAVESVTRQVKIALRGVPSHKVRDVLFAYEPVWAIGEQGKPADPEQANGMHEAIRVAIAQLHGDLTARTVPILYGGSVDLTNASAYASQPSVDGLFIGRVSLDVASFIECIHIFEKTRRGD